MVCSGAIQGPWEDTSTPGGSTRTPVRALHVLYLMEMPGPVVEPPHTDEYAQRTVYMYIDYIPRDPGEDVVDFKLLESFVELRDSEAVEPSLEAKEVLQSQGVPSFSP